MISVLNQNGDTKLDITMYFKKKHTNTLWSICTIDTARNENYLARYSTKKQCDEVFNSMLYWEQHLETQIYCFPKDDPDKYQ